MRKPFIKLLLAGLGYMFMGNLLASVMTLALAFFRMEILIMGIAVLLAMAIYLMLVSVPAYKDGQEIKKSRNGGIPKWRWAVIGVIVWAVAAIPSVIFLIERYNTGAYRFINGAVNPLSAFFLTGTGQFMLNPAGVEVEIMRLASFAPYVFIGFYALTIPACHIGFIMGLKSND